MTALTPDPPPQTRLAAAGAESARPDAVLCFVFSLSGAAALIFENLFFRLAGLALGNSVQAASIVLFSFMAGLGLGNALAHRVVRGFGRPLLLFALLETTVALYGAGLVGLFPAVTQALVPLFRPFLDAGAGLQVLRLAVAFVLFVTPAIAMGMTLPVLVGALSVRDPNFGSVLGRLYGWNTAGAVAGTLVAERVLVTQLGVPGAGLAAASLNGVAVALALRLRRGPLGDALPRGDRAAAPGAAPGRSLLLAGAFVSGGILLGLEVVWFRFFLLFTSAYSWNLAVMLATVLAGIAAGGIAGGQWCRQSARAQRWAAPVAALAGASVALLYAGLSVAWPRLPELSITGVFVYLMFPVCFLSGLLFTLLGRALEAGGLPPTLAAARLALANTAGSALGSLIAGFVLIPAVGVEASLLLFTLAYGGAAVLIAIAGREEGAGFSRRFAAAAGLFAIGLVCFPRGALETRILGMPGSIRARFLAQGQELVGFREAVTETVQYFRKSLFGQPQHYTLVTNNHSMAATSASNRRYMKAYVYWPVAMNPEIRSACLISYGVGATAAALAATRSLESIDVVDVSRAVLDMSEIVYPDPREHPLHDPRVRVHVEDGRFFLQTSARRFDLITGEPPPPRHAGVGSLYSREYFRLIRERLGDGGVVSYWLSIHQLRPAEAKAILRGFCDVFPNCSLWSGFGLDWMMLAVKNPGEPPSPEAFARQWRDPALAGELTALGFATPQALGAGFIADGERLRRWIGDAPPLVDAFPQRIASRPIEVRAADLRAYREFMGDPEAQQNFAASPELARVWPAAYRRASAERARLWQLLSVDLWQAPPYQNLLPTLRAPELAPFLPWLMGSDADAVAIAARALAADPQLLAAPELGGDALRHLAAAALVRRDLPRAERALARWSARLAVTPGAARTRDMVDYFRATLGLARGDGGRARQLEADVAARTRDDPERAQRTLRFARWADARFGRDERARGAGPVAADAVR